MGKNYKGNHYKKNKDGYFERAKSLWPPLLMVGLVPLLIGQYEYENDLTDYGWFNSQNSSVDFFLAWKSFALLCLAIVMACCIAIRLWKSKRNIAFCKLFIPLFLYGILAFLSACFSIKPTFSFAGGAEQFETFWALLSYVLVTYYIFLYAQTEQKLQILTDAICLSSTVIGVLGTLQGIGFDLFATVPFQKLITTKEFLESVGGTLQVRFGENRTIITLYNPNYVGVFGSLLVPFLGIMLLFEKNRWRRLWHGCNLMLVMITLLSSRSRAGLIAAIAAFCVAAIFSFHKLAKWWFLTIPAINFAIVLVLLVNAYNDNEILDRFKNVFKPDEITVTEERAENGSVIRKTGLTEIYTTPEGVAFRYNEIYMKVTLYVGNGIYGFYAIDESGNQIELIGNAKGTEFSFEHPALSDVKVGPIYIGDQLGFQIRTEENWTFLYDYEKECFQYITPYGKLSDMIVSESYGFENRQRFFSGRGFIWSRTLPLLKEHIFLGSGPDTFVLEFPHEDYLAMKQNGYEGIIITKPHSWYLQVGVQTGILSLLCLLVFYGWYAVQSIRLYAFKKLSTQTEAFGIAAFIGSIGYMISGISNDSMVVTAPVFWGIIGLGITSNMMVSRQRKETA